jgi:inner membrane protein
LPDLDVVGFALGIPYGDPLGHRGASHAFFTAALVATAAAFGFRRRPLPSFLFLFAAMGSHGLLDMLTDGGRGIALLWPFSERRMFAPFTPIEVSPIGLGNFLSGRGLEVMLSELLWIWAPAVAAVLVLRSVGPRIGTAKG